MSAPTGPILTQFDQIAAGGGDPGQIAGAQMQFILTQVRQNALPFFRELRDDRPILRTARVTLVSRFRDVEEIFHRELVFSVGPYLPRMMGVIGPFVLSQDITPRYDHDISAMRLAIRREDVGRVRARVAETAEAIVDRLAAGGAPFDIVRPLTRTVPVLTARDYLGVFAPHDAQMMDWARACFREFFVNLANRPEMRAPAVAAGAELMDRIAELMGRRRASGAEIDDVLGRLLAQQRAGEGHGFDDEGVCRTLAGFITGMVETTSQAAVHALLSLFAHPDRLAEASAAAREDRDEDLAALVFEALRFRPVNPLVERLVREDYLLGAGARHATLIPKGATVFALSWSAMFDERVLEAPEEFRPGRPASHYLHFATGRHTCFGKYISQAQIPGILKPLLRREGLRPAGDLKLDGTFPDELPVAVGP